MGLKAKGDRPYFCFSYISNNIN